MPQEHNKTNIMQKCGYALFIEIVHRFTHGSYKSITIYLQMQMTCFQRLSTPNKISIPKIS